MTLQEKFEERLRWKFLTEDHPNKENNRQIALKLCAQDATFFIDNFGFTYDPRGQKDVDKHLPFLLYDFQDILVRDIVKHVSEGNDLHIDKSRDMGASWCLISTVHWGWKFHAWDALFGSRKASLVDIRGDNNSLIQKIRYLESRLPSWLKTNLTEGENDKMHLLKHPGTGAVIAGESNNPHFGTGGRYNVIVFDEFSKWELTDEIAWRSAGDSTPCRIANSTPSDRGMNCHFYKLIETGIDRQTLHWVLHPKKRKGLYYEQNNVKHFIPDTDLKFAQELWKSGVKLGSEWYDRECKRRSDVEIAQELDIAYDASLAGAIFGKFDFETQVGDYAYDPNRPLYLAADYGMDTTALLWIQSDGNKYYVVDEYENKGEDIMHYIQIIKAKPYKDFVCYGDPHSGDIRQINSSRTVSQILKQNGIRVQTVDRVSIEDRINASKMLIQHTYVDKRCPLFQDTILKWRFRKPARQNDRPVPEHSQFSHLGEAFGYFALGIKQPKHRVYQQKVWQPHTSGVML